MFRNDKTGFYTLAKQWLVFIVAIQFLPLILTADQITITGNYLDRKSNPIVGASVKYFSNIAQLDSSGTDDNGYFTLNIQTVGIEAETLPNRFHLGQNYPNPFNPETRIPVATPYPVTLSLFNIRGQLVDKINIPIGLYDIVWGGLDRNSKPVGAGIYILLLKGNNMRLSRRITLLDGGRQSRLRLEKHQSTVQRSDLAKASTIDEIHFIKPNTTTKVIQLKSATQDTSLGVISGNVGPAILQSIEYDSCHIDESRDWNLNGIIYNDGDSRYSLKDTAEFYFQYYPHILKFNSYTPGDFSTTLYIDDITDPSLKDSMQLKYKVLAGGSPGTLPWQFADIPDMTISEDDTLKLDMLQFVEDGRWPDICGYGIDTLANATFYNELNDVWIIPEPDYNGIIDSIVIWVKDMDHDQRVYLKPFNLTVTPVNDAPVFTGNVPNYTIPEDSLVRIPAHSFFTDVDGDALDYIIQNLGSNATQEDSSGVVIVKPSLGWNGTLSGLVLEAMDAEASAQSNEFEIEVTPPPMTTVHFLLKDFYTDSTITVDTSTFWVGDSIYQSLDGTLALTLPRGSYEFNATNPNTIDGLYWWAADHYTFLRRPGNTENFEQRAKNDTSSPIIFSTENDTILVYKIMSDYPLPDAAGILDSEAQGTVRFGPNDLNAPAWWNMNYTAPDSATHARVIDLLENHLPAATKNKLWLQYQEGTVEPTDSHLWMAIDPGVPGPTNGTTYDPNTNEIIECHARWPNQPITKDLWIETLQAIGNLYDVGGVDPPILSHDGPDYYINELGQQLLGLLYFVQPKTQI